MEKIDFNHSEQCTLTFRAGVEGMALAVFNPLADEGPDALQVKYLPVDESLPLAANVKQVLDGEEWLHHAFKRMNLLLVTRRFTLVPSEYFREDLAEELFYHNHPRQAHEEVRWNMLHADNAVLLFGIDRSLCAVVSNCFPDARYWVQVAPLIEKFSVQSRLGNTRKMFAHLRREYVDVFCYDHGRLLLANSYKCRVTSDRIYYLLYVWQTLHFEQERDELHLCGKLDDKEALLAELREFVRQVFVMNPSGDIDLQAILTMEE